MQHGSIGPTPWGRIRVPKRNELGGDGRVGGEFQIGWGTVLPAIRDDVLRRCIVTCDIFKRSEVGEEGWW